jgi:hypothetical protein
MILHLFISMGGAGTSGPPRWEGARPDKHKYNTKQKESEAGKRRRGVDPLCMFQFFPAQVSSEHAGFREQAGEETVHFSDQQFPTVEQEDHFPQ